MRKTKIGGFKNYKGFFDIFKQFFSFGFALKFVIFIVFLSGLLYYWSFAFDFVKSAVKKISVITISTVGKAVGEDIEKDELGQINVLIVGYGGEKHQGGFLADTIMIASFNPKLGVVTFLSIPRDFYVKYPRGAGRINGLFADTYYSTKSLDTASKVLIEKVKEISGVEIKYYALIDFEGFKGLIDSLGGVDIDVPYDLVDTQYPTPNGGYTTFKVLKGLQHMDGETALKYARSRHSTSDFSRALRQQQIVQALIDKLLKIENFNSIDKIKTLYAQYKNMVYTNISLKQIIGMSQYINSVKKFYSFVYNIDCDPRFFKTTDYGCLLYYPPRDWFGGASVILPMGAGPSNISYYKHTQDFAFNVVYNQKFLLEDAKITIINGMDKKTRGYNVNLANSLGVELKKYGFNVVDVGNIGKNDIPYETTKIYVNKEKDYKTTLDLLKIYVSGEVIKADNTSDITIVLGNDYVKKY